MKGIVWTAALLITTASAFGEPNPSHEHAGDVFQYFHGFRHWFDDGVINNGTPAGETVELGGENVYLSYPRRNQTEYGILYLTDIFGNALVNNKLLADSLARAGYFVAMPDLFQGDPVPVDAMSNPNSGFNMTEWRARHPQSQVEGIIETAIEAVRSEFGTTKLGATGYCFGGKYVAIFLAEGRGIDAGFTAHPSSVTADEWESIAGPISIEFGELDNSNTPENRTNIEAIFAEGNKTFQTSLYADAEHGFAVRTDLTDKKKAFAQESAYL
ncbi:Protein AIM2 [Cyphellophora attinorum]|uniref:Protein AIM2 n=1 Tax=Cyphellophora attinorum TaxID=1664694 RepID=A0A0N1HLY1_9EURO|nr:Protein AIM2 [Phialophora attinorum]KPI38143.1 Protein AIM2 [Phialophora attinorum]